MSDRKKQRGQRRRLNVLLENICGFTPFQNTSSTYEHFHVPSNMFIEHKKTAGWIKTAFIRSWISKTEEIIKLKPKELPFCKVVAMIDVPNLWSSQIIIFYEKDYYDTFWERNSKGQIWRLLERENLSLVKERNIVTFLCEKGYEEIIGEGEELEKAVLWFYGDL